MGQLRYYDEDDIQKIADSTRNLIGSESKLKVSQIGDYLITKELKDKRVPVNSKGFYIKYFTDISPYRNGVISSDDSTTLSSNHTLYPKLSYEDGYDYQKYIFFGWYTDKNCTSNQISKVAFTGGAYAKFVPIDLFTGHIYADEITDVDPSEKINLTCVFGVPDEYFSGATLKFRLGGYDRTQRSGDLSTKVYDRVISKNSTYRICAEELNEHAKYVFVWMLTNVASVNYNLPVVINICILLSDGTELILQSYSSSTNEIFNNIVHVPIVMNSVYPINQGKFDVQFNPNIFTYHDYDNCLTTDNLIIDTSDVSNGILHISFNFNEETTLTESITNLKFTSNDTIPEYNIFRLSNQEFWNKSGQVFMHLEDAVYRRKEPRYVGDVASFSLNNIDISNTYNEDTIDISTLEWEVF